MGEAVARCKIERSGPLFSSRSRTTLEIGLKRSLPMPIPALMIALAALAGPAAPPPANDQIIVRGHSWAPFISPMGEPFR
ncbi:MAG: hypothetical protein V4491_06270, partial [Pseudomonadota bacterium]